MKNEQIGRFAWESDLKNKNSLENQEIGRFARESVLSNDNTLELVWIDELLIEAVEAVDADAVAEIRGINFCGLFASQPPDPKVGK